MVIGCWKVIKFESFGLYLFIKTVYFHCLLFTFSSCLLFYFFLSIVYFFFLSTVYFFSCLFLFFLFTVYCFLLHFQIETFSVPPKLRPGMARQTTD